MAPASSFLALLYIFIILFYQYKPGNPPINQMTEQGLQRVIVEHVTPEIDGGRFFIKKVAGESIKVEADIFTDGHDHIGARLLYRHENDKTWLYVPMHMVNNDRWQASFDLEKTGFYY